MNTRQAKLLSAIIDQFIQTAEPVGSLNLLAGSTFQVSGATLRNEMRLLCQEGYLEQPHVSAGRIPTAKGYQLYVREYIEPSKELQKVRKDFNRLKEAYVRRKDQERVYEAVTLLSHMIPNVAFATVPHKDMVYYVGLANTLRQPEFQQSPDLASDVVEVLESGLASLLEGAELDDRVHTYIGEGNLLPQIQSCSMLVTRYDLRGAHGAIGILGPMRMDYAYNTAALDLIRDFLKTT
jgi:transcriptional regulator of heat shock response